LPEELVKHILSTLTAGDIKTAVLVCKQWHNVVKENPLTLVNFSNAYLRDVCPRSFVNNITDMVLKKGFRFIEEDMNIISKCINLKTLRTDSEIELRLWPCFAPLKNLEQLILESQSEYDLNVISKFLNLKTLSIEFCNTECPKKFFVQALKKLRRIESLGRIYFGNAKLWALFPVLPNLKEIEVHFSEPKAEDISEMVEKFKLIASLRYVTMTVHDPVPENRVSLMCLSELVQLTRLKLHVAASWPESDDQIKSFFTQTIPQIELTRCYLDHSV